MFEFQEKRRVKRFIYSKITLVILVILVVLLLNAVWKVYQKQDYTKDNLAKAAASLNSLQAREKMLSSEIERLKTADGIEGEIRAKYGLVKPGEEVIIVVDKDDDFTSSQGASKASFWEEFLGMFK
jgi:cell division protein FtsB